LAETLTPHFGWTKPDPGASANTWGTTLNATTDKVDAQCFANQQAGIPIGSGALWFTTTPPTNWLICDGSSLSTAAPYDKLFAAIGYTYGGSGANFNLPNFSGRFPMATTLAAAGGEATHVLAAGEMPVHNHGASDGGHQHVVNLAQSPHNHGDPGHSHTDAGHTHPVGNQNTVPAGPGGVAVAWTGGGNTGLGYASISTSGTGIQAANANVVIQAQNGTGGPYTNLGYSSISVGNAGGDGGHNNLPPYLGVNFIIKFA
jgi:microcystin-dependent protein